MGCFNREIICCVIYTILLSACTTGMVSKPLNDTNTVRGPIYRLKTTKLKVEVSYELRSCSPVEVRIVSATVTPQIVDDLGKNAGFVLDQNKMDSWLKIVNPAVVELTGLGLKKVSYTAQDKTSEFIKGAAKLFTTFSTPGAGAPNVMMTLRLAEKNAVVCNLLTTTALVHRGKLEGAINTLREKWIATQKQLATSSGDQLTNKVKEAKALKTGLGELETEVGNLAANYLRASYTKTVIPTTKNLTEISITPSVSEFEKWFTSSSALAPVTKKASLSLSLSKTSGGNLIEGKLPIDPETKGQIEGVYYRTPVAVNLKITLAASPAKPYKNVGGLSLLQFGPVGVIEIKNRIFQDTIHTVQFGADGNLTNFDFSSKNAEALQLLNAAQSVVDTIGTQEIKKLEHEKKLDEAKKNAVEARINRIKKEKELDGMLQNSK